MENEYVSAESERVSSLSFTQQFSPRSVSIFSVWLWARAVSAASRAAFSASRSLWSAFRATSSARLFTVPVLALLAIWAVRSEILLA